MLRPLKEVCDLSLFISVSNVRVWVFLKVWRVSIIVRSIYNIALHC